MLAATLAASAAGASLRAVDLAPALAAAQAATAIPSTEEDALPPPSVWTCTLLVDEYRQWLEQGNDPKDWKYVGKSYVDAEGETYTWLDWIDWINAQGCVDGGLVKPEIAPLAAASLLPSLFAPAIPAATTAVLAIDNKSPG